MSNKTEKPSRVRITVNDSVTGGGEDGEPLDADGGR